MQAPCNEVPRLSPLRVGVGSLVLTAHLVVLVLMSLAQPVAPGAGDVMRPGAPIMVDIRPPETRVLIPPPPMPTAPERRRQRLEPTPAPTVAPVEVESAWTLPAPVLSPVDPEQFRMPAGFNAPVDAPDTGGVGALVIVYGPEPPYPARAKRMGWQGEVHLRLRVGADGLPLAVEVLRSSGHAELDRAARRHVQQYWRFAPPAQEVVAELPIRYWLY